MQNPLLAECKQKLLVLMEQLLDYAEKFDSLADLRILLAACDEMKGKPALAEAMTRLEPKIKRAAEYRLKRLDELKRLAGKQGSTSKTLSLPKCGQCQSKHFERI